MSDYPPFLIVPGNGSCGFTPHALTAAVLAYVLGRPDMTPFLVLGAGIIDADILFTHGGMAHSIGGAVGMAVLAWAGIALATLAGAVTPVLPAPASDTKYTVGLLPGPSILLATTSLLFLLWMGLGVISFPGMITPYVARSSAHSLLSASWRSVSPGRRWMAAGGPFRPPTPSSGW